MDELQKGGWNVPERRWAPLRTYILALGAVLIAVLVRRLLEPLIGYEVPFLTVFFAVICTARFAGRGPAIAAFLTGGLAVAWFILPPRYSFAVEKVADQTKLVLFGIVCIATISMFDSMDRARKRLEEMLVLRRRAEKRLAEREQLLQITFASIGDAIITTDLRGIVTYLNLVAEKLTGWTNETGQGKPLSQVFSIIDEKSGQVVEYPAYKALRSGPIAGLVDHPVLLARDGTRRPIEESAASVRDPEGALAGVILVFRDISERRQVELRTLGTLERLHLAAKAVNGIIYEYDLQTEEIRRSMGLAEVLGFQPDEVPATATWWWGQLHPNDRARSRLTIKQMMQTGGNMVSEYRVRHKDGRWLHVMDRAMVLKHSDGRPVKIIGCAIDISDRKLVEEALKESEQRFRTLAESLPQIVFTSNGDGELDWVNSRWREYSGLTLDETRGDDLGGTIHPDDVEGNRLAWSEAVSSGEKFESEFRCRCVDGSYRWLMCRAIPSKDSEGRVVKWYGTSTDMDELRHAQDALQEADKRKDEFLAILAHELRNPLAPVRNSLELMKLANDRPDILERARATMERQIGLMVRLIDDLMDVSRISRNKLELRKERVELTSIMQQAIDGCRSHWERAGHEVSVEFPSDPVELHADPVRLAQVFGNLLTNACKYTEPGGKISLSAIVQQSEVIVTVRDNGTGIPSEMLPKVFDLFTQIDRTLERSEGGLGIGLSLVKRLVEMHGGTVTACSGGKGLGSEFIVRLPVLGTGLGAGDPAAIIPHSGEVIPGRILVVDDNKDAATSLAMLLGNVSNEIMVAYDGAQALETAAEFKPDIVILDIGLPKMNGYDVCRAIRSQPWGREVILIALTGWGQEEDRRKSREAGFNGHLVKPVEQSVLLKLLAKYQRMQPQGV